MSFWKRSQPGQNSPRFSGISRTPGSTIKATKKGEDSPSLSSTPQKSTASMSQKEKEKEKTQPSLQIIQETLMAIQASMQSREDAKQQHEALRAEMNELKVASGDMKDRIKDVGGKVEEIQQTLKENEKRISTVETNMEKVMKKLEDTEDSSMMTQRRNDETFIQIEMQLAAYGLRFQNVVEEKDEDLHSKMAEIIGDILQSDPQELAREIDEVYRVQTSFVRRHNLPREVHIKFTRKCIRDDVLKWSRTKVMKFQGKDLIILKQVPRRVRESRREFYFLTKILIKKEIPFRWLIPEGLSLYWQGTRIKLETVEDARDFYEVAEFEKFEQIRQETQEKEKEKEKEVETQVDKEKDKENEKEREKVKELYSKVVLQQGAAAPEREETSGARRKQPLPQRETYTSTRLREPKEPKRYYK